eukprot:2616278-Ditylum_brightwellii.AAC.1
MKPHTLRGRWARQMMRLKPAPYTSVRAFLWGEEIIRGDRRCKANPLCLDRVEQNLSGDSNYDPRIAWTGWQGEQKCALVMHCVGSMLNHLGQQDAAWKT